MFDLHTERLPSQLTLKTLNIKTLYLLLSFILIASAVFAQKYSISGGNAYSIYLSDEGNVYAFGQNDFGQLGLNSSLSPRNINEIYSSPQQLYGLPQINKITAGSGSHVMAVTCDGNVISWGRNIHGELGDPSLPTGPEAYSTAPVTVVGTDGSGELSGIVEVYLSSDFSFALSADGHVLSWGYNAEGQLGRNTIELNSAIPGYVLDENDEPLTNIIEISAGDYGGYALSEEGIIYSWGDQGDNSLGRPTFPLNRAMPVEIQSGENLNNIRSFTSGDTHVLALDSSGNVWSWGGDWGPGQLGQGDFYNSMDYAAKVVGGASGETYLGDSDPIVNLAATQASSGAVTKNGLVYLWGATTWFSPEVFYDSTGVLSNGCISYPSDVEVGRNTPNEAPMLALFDEITPVTDIINISRGETRFFITDNFGKLYSTGFNRFGNLGNGTTENVCYFTEMNLPESPSFSCPEVNLESEITICTGDTASLMPGTLYPGFKAELWYNGNMVQSFTNNAESAEFIQPEFKIGITENNTGIYEVRFTDIRTTEEVTCQACITSYASVMISTYETSFSDPRDLVYAPSGSNTNCDEGEAFVYVDGKPGKTYVWYADSLGMDSLSSSEGSQGTCINIASANSKGSAPNRNWSLYVKDISSANEVIRPIGDTASFNGKTIRTSQENDEFDRIYFNALTDFNLNGITVQIRGYATETATFILHIRNSDGLSIGTLSAVDFPVTADEQISVNLTGTIKVPAATGYYLDFVVEESSIPMIWYENGPVNWYPATYTLGNKNVLTITNNSEEFSSFYQWSSPGIWNWEINTATNAYPCNNGLLKINVNEEGPLSLSKTTNNTGIMLFPNPVQNELNFTKPISNGEVYDAFGRKINTIRNARNFNCSSLESGMYFIKSEQGIFRFEVAK